MERIISKWRPLLILLATFMFYFPSVIFSQNKLGENTFGFTYSYRGYNLKSLNPGFFDIDAEEINKKYGDENSKWIDINGLKVHYKDEGEGPVILLLHGTLSSLHTWDAWVNALKDHYRIIRLDIPGFGLTGPANFEFNEKNLGKFFYDFISAMRIDHFSVAGSSLGGYMAWKFAVYAPQHIDNLVLVAPAGYPQDLPGALKWYTVPVIDWFATQITPRWIFELSIDSLYGDKEKLTEKVVDRYYELLLRDGNRTSAREIMEYLDSRKNEYPLQIASIKTPTLIMWGGKDVWVPTNFVKKWVKDMPHAKLIIYKGVGHLPAEEIPIKSAKDLHDFLS
ncbi:MAG: alpha/beta fold hydrolase [Desulfobacteraceae bacterium]|nr:alpha/beta hydrolase [Desulfobacteraceae bacterium]MBC2757466.1 alpha/beta fold hydrolase [Desulfobacteraceae bacterium]